jgi:putative FmdB family regulatory protein
MTRQIWNWNESSKGKIVMPVYIYHCENCGVQFEKQQSFSDHPLVRCPECGKKALKKVYQPVGIVFKGSGFYATDHHSPSGLSSKKTDEKSEKDSKVSSASKDLTAKGEISPKKSTNKSSEKSPGTSDEKRE